MRSKFNAIYEAQVGHWYCNDPGFTETQMAASPAPRSLGTDSYILKLRAIYLSHEGPHGQLVEYGTRAQNGYAISDTLRLARRPLIFPTPN